MQRAKSIKRGRWMSLLIAGGVGYLVGGWHTAMLRGNDASPAQTVAMRFPEPAPANAAVPDETPVGAASVSETANAANANVLGKAQLALLSPAPLIPRPVTAPRAEAPSVSRPAPEQATISPMPTPRPKPAALRTIAEARVAPAYRQPDRPGFVLDDAQIASIKGRLHLTPDQERMWPAVEAALRNIAYEKMRDARRRGAPAGGSDVASLDPNGAAVQDLKSAAIPLIMSFNDEQKNEVRSLAHVMGLDRLASEM